MSSAYLDAVRSSRTETVLCDAWRNGSVVATDLEVISGSVTDDSSPGVRRKLDINLYPTLGLYEALSPIGTELRPRSVLRYGSGLTETVPLGVFDIDAQTMGYGSDGDISVKGSDKWVRIQRARFLKPTASAPGITVRQQIANLIRGALGPTEPVIDLASSTATVGALVWDRDRDKAIIELADSIGAYVSFDRDGVATIQDVPRIGGTSVWNVDASQTGILLDANRDRSRSKTYNVVVVTSEKTDGGVEPFDPQVAWDNDPFSPTYAGNNPTDPANIPGPFGVVPYFQTSPLYESAGQALEAARTILARSIGLEAQLSLTSVRNHALDALDVIDVMLPPERYDQAQVVERHIVDRVTHPLMPSGTQTIDTRSTRPDELDSAA